MLLVPEARRTLALADHARNTVRRAARGEIGVLRVGFSGNAAFVGRLAADLRAFRREHPEVEITALEAAPKQQAQAILAGEIDVGYCPSFDLTVPPDLRAEPIGTWPWAVALVNDHLLARKHQVAASALTEETVIIYSEGTEGTVEGPAALARHLLGHEPARVLPVAETLTALTLAAAGLGIALVPASMEVVALPGLAYRALADTGRHVDLVRLHRLREGSGAVRAFLSLTRESTPQAQ